MRMSCQSTDSESDAVGVRRVSGVLAAPPNIVVLAEWGVLLGQMPSSTWGLPVLQVQVK